MAVDSAPGSREQHGSHALRRRQLGVAHIVFFIVAASAPLTAVAGGVPTSFAVTGVAGIPSVYLIIAAMLVLFSIGYAAMSRRISNAGAFYAYVSQGIGRPAGVGASFVALVAYNAMQIGIYGLFGFVAASLLEGEYGISIPWWAIVYACIGVVGVLGVLRVDLNAKVLAVLLVVESLVVIVFDLAALTQPGPAGITFDTFGLDALSTGAFGAALIFVTASFVGFESAAIYGEECRDPRRDVARATYIAVVIIGVFYALSAWAMSVATGPDQIVAQSQELGPDLLFALTAERIGGWFATLAGWLFLTSIFAALLSFHNAVARYFFALGRERVLPSALGRTHERTGAPHLGSLTQSALALLVVTAFVLAGQDPVLTLFTWLVNVGALGVIVLMAATSLAVIGFLRSHARSDATTGRLVAAGLAALSLITVAVLGVAKFDALIGPDQGALLRWGLPGLLLVAAVAGTAWGVGMRSRDPQAYERIGRGGEEPAFPAVGGPPRV